MKDFSNIEVFKQGGRILRKYYKELTLAFLAYVLVTFLPKLILSPETAFVEQSIPVTLALFLFTVFISFLGLIVQVGVIKNVIDAAGEIKPNLRDLYLNYRRVPSYLLTSFVASLISLIGLFLLIVPFFFLTARYQFSLFYVIEKKVGMAEALYLSDKMTRGSIWKIVKFDLFLIFINILPFLPMLIARILGAQPPLSYLFGLFALFVLFTASVSFISLTVLYKKFNISPKA